MRLPESTYLPLMAVITIYLQNIVSEINFTDLDCLIMDYTKDLESYGGLTESAESAIFNIAKVLGLHCLK